MRQKRDGPGAEHGQSAAGAGVGLQASAEAGSTGSLQGTSTKVAYYSAKEKKKGWLQLGVQPPVYALQLSAAPPSQLVPAAIQICSYLL